MVNSKLTTALLEQQFKFKQGHIGDAATPISHHILKGSYTQAELDRMGAEVMVSNMGQLKDWLKKFPAVAAKLAVVSHNPKDIGFDATFNGKQERFDFPFNTGAFFEQLGLLPHQARGNLSEALLGQDNQDGQDMSTAIESEDAGHIREALGRLYKNRDLNPEYRNAWSIGVDRCANLLGVSRSRIRSFAAQDSQRGAGSMDDSRRIAFLKNNLEKAIRDGEDVDWHREQLDHASGRVKAGQLA